jgi:hypothetical protein
MVVEIRHGKESADSFIILTNESKHKCQIYGNFNPGRPKFHKDTSLLIDKAPNATALIGYRDLNYRLVREFYSNDMVNRFVRITGPRGVGKSSFACYSANFIQERGFLDGGCIYLNCQ